MSLCGCRAVLDSVNPKIMEEGVKRGGTHPDGWYRYMPQRDPGFCLMTRRAVIWHDAEMNLGYWRGLHPEPPHRVLMEARGNTFILHRPYVWDGMSWGHTRPRDLRPSLLHDALYHALQGGAPFPRREADRAFLRLRRSQHVPDALGEYLVIRWFGWAFNDPHGEVTILIEKTAPQQPAAPLETDNPPPSKKPVLLGSKP